MIGNQLVKFFMWCTVLNVALLILFFIAWIFMRDFIYRMHGRFFDMDRKTFDTVFYSFMGFYKIIIFVFNLVPWIALAIIY